MPRADPVTFARRLRAAGVRVPVSAVITYARALAVLGVQRPDDVYWAGRLTLVGRVEDIVAYDDCFAAFFLNAPAVGAARPEPDRPVAAVHDGAHADGRDGTGRELEQRDGPVRGSRVEVLSQRDLAACSDEELAELWPVVAAIRLSGSRRSTRRTTAQRQASVRLDVRRTVRDSLRTDGEPIRRRHRRRDVRPRRVVLLVDVSGSMAPYARALLRFAHASVLARRPVEVFALGTRLTRLTRELSSHDPDAALRGAGAAIPDYAGGTRLGDTLGEFNDRWGLRGMARGAEVVVLSDGWDRGDPGELARQMARLHLVTHQLVWVNPLRAAPDYAPLARGMAAALPHVDRFVDGHSVASLQALAGVLAGGGDPVDRDGSGSGGTPATVGPVQEAFRR